MKDQYFLVHPVIKKDGSFTCKHRRTEKMKTKVYNFTYKINTNSF